MRKELFLRGLKLHDVLIVGGGPVGSYVAYKLAGMGYDVAVLEQRERLGGQVCCTGIISQACASSFAIDSGVVLRWANSAKVFSPSGKLIRLWRPENQVCIVDREALDVAMASRAKDAGADYVLNCPVREIEVRDDRVILKAVGHRQRLSFEARAVVIATGFGSRLADRLGLGKVSDFVTGAQAEVTTRDVDEVEVYFGREISPGFFAWLVPTTPSRALAGLLSRRSPGLYLRRLISSLLAQGKIVSADGELSYRSISLKPLARTYGQRLIVVGDAAGQVKPTTGGGIYFGLLCADIAANNLHRALKRDDLSANSLASYEREWKRKLGQELRIGYWARRFYELLSDRQIDHIFDIIRANGIDEALLKADDLSFDWHGRVALRLMGQRALSKTIRAIKKPLDKCRLSSQLE